MIHVSPGHEQSISSEVFIKAYSLLPPSTQNLFTLHTQKYVIKQFFEMYNIPYQIKKNVLYWDHHSLLLKLFPPSNLSFSQAGIESALGSTRHFKDVIITLPTDKKSFLLKKKRTLGHTEFLRSFFKLPYLTMGFKHKNTIFMLLTDHIPLKEVSSSLTIKLIQNKVLNSLAQINDLYKRPHDVYLAGVNPHAGENGLLGIEESLFSTLPSYIKGPLPADSIHLYLKEKKPQVFIFNYHDQALTLFKSRYGIMGSNITFGLPFLRLSVDHGTAFNLYGKNKADPTGCYYTMLEAIAIHRFYRKEAI